MIEMKFQVKRAVVLLTNATDIVCLTVDLPTAFPEAKYDVGLRIDARYDYGVTWCKEALGITPEVINTRV